MSLFIFLCVLSISVVNLYCIRFAFSAAFSRTTAALSGISRTSHLTIALIQRLPPSNPPVISATEGSPVGGQIAQVATNSFELNGKRILLTIDFTAPVLK